MRAEEARTPFPIKFLWRGAERSQRIWESRAGVEVHQLLDEVHPTDIPTPEHRSHMEETASKT